MFLIDCPHCGSRNVSEFRYGGELRSSRPNSPERGWADQIYNRRNVLGVQTEWWYHRMGCRRWFLARRHTMRNEVLETFWPGQKGDGENRWR